MKNGIAREAVSDYGCLYCGLFGYKKLLNTEGCYFEPNKIYYLHTPQFEVGAADILMKALMEASEEN